MNKSDKKLLIYIIGNGIGCVVTLVLKMDGCALFFMSLVLGFMALFTYVEPDKLPFWMRRSNPMKTWYRKRGKLAQYKKVVLVLSYICFGTEIIYLFSTYLFDPLFVSLDNFLSGRLGG